MSEVLLQQVAREIRKQFAEEKSKILGRKYKPHVRTDSKDGWSRAAQLCIELDADPVTFVRSAFHACTVRSGPFSNNMAGAAMRKWYKEYMRSYPSKLIKVIKEDGEITEEYSNPPKEEIMSEIDSVRRVVYHRLGEGHTEQQLIEEMLYSVLNLSALGCALIGWGDERVRAMYGAEAKSVLLGRPDLVSVGSSLGYATNNILEYDV